MLSKVGETAVLAVGFGPKNDRQSPPGLNPPLGLFPGLAVGLVFGFVVPGETLGACASIAREPKIVRNAALDC